MVEFGGWTMPLHYGSQLDEHHAVRRNAGMFDVSHMLAVDLAGSDATPFLRRLLTNDVARLKTPGKGLYSCMCASDGGVIDDLIVHRFSDHAYRMVVNAATAEDDVRWMRGQIAAMGANVTLEARRQLAMVAVQGPQAIACAQAAIPELNTSSGIPERFVAHRLCDLQVARTGYTGEDGLEITAPAARIGGIWQALLDQGVTPCGLGARDTLRMEAGMCLYGQDLSRRVTPLQSGLEWTVDFRDETRTFNGREALVQAEPGETLRGIVLDTRGVMRHGMIVQCGEHDGLITSGGFSPTLERSIGIVRLPLDCRPGDSAEVDIRGRWLPARLCALPFVRHGQSQLDAT